MLAKQSKRFLMIAAVAGASFAGGVIAAQPHMQAAKDNLQAAKAQLQAATSNKGGHRVKTIELIDSALVQVNRGIEAGGD